MALKSCIGCIFFIIAIYRLGFLGLLHMEVFNQRLEQEYNASVIVTTPTVPYKAILSSAKLIKAGTHPQGELLRITSTQAPVNNRPDHLLWSNTGIRGERDHHHKPSPVSRPLRGIRIPGTHGLGNHHNSRWVHWQNHDPMPGVHRGLFGILGCMEWLWFKFTNLVSLMSMDARPSQGTLGHNHILIGRYWDAILSHFHVWGFLEARPLRKCANGGNSTHCPESIMKMGFFRIHMHHALFHWLIKHIYSVLNPKNHWVEFMPVNSFVWCILAESQGHPEEHVVHWWQACDDEVPLSPEWSHRGLLRSSKVTVFWICQARCHFCFRHLVTLSP